MSHVFTENVVSVMSAETYQPTPEGALVARFKSQTVNYNFDVYGAGIVGDNALALTVPLPAGSIIIRVIITSTVRIAGPTAIGLGIVAVGDMIGISDIIDNWWNTGSSYAPLTDPLPVTPTDIQELIFTFETNVATAGDVTFTIEWM